jgi:uncharacterized membrane protein
VATHLRVAAQHLTGATQSFYAIYLFSHGFIKVVLVAGLLREKLIAYPLSLFALGAFIAYQLYPRHHRRWSAWPERLST